MKLAFKLLEYIKKMGDEKMRNIKELFRSIEEVSKIAFKIMDKDGEVYTSKNLNIKSTFAKAYIELLGYELVLMVNSKDKSVLPLLVNYIASKVREESERESYILKNIIDNQDYSKNEVEKLYPFLCDRFVLITINMKNSIKESIDMINDGYDNESVCIVNYKNNILILGMLDDPSEHAQSLKETLEYNTKEKCIISYSFVDGYENLSMEVKKSLKKIRLAQKYNLESEVISMNSLIFEEIVDSIDEKSSDLLVERYGKGFKKLDEEMIKSIEVFFKCGLNISESAKLLYIHRNTLIYRIEKLQRYTGFDIKNFNEAIVFKVLYCLWKEKKNNF